MLLLLLPTQVRVLLKLLLLALQALAWREGRVSVVLSRPLSAEALLSLPLLLLLLIDAVVSLSLGMLPLLPLIRLPMLPEATS